MLINRSDGRLKLSNLGLARNYSILATNRLTNEVISLWYFPPEILLGSMQYGSEVDVFAIGTIFSEMIMKQPLFPCDSNIDQLYKIFQQLGTPNNSIWSGVTALPHWNVEFPKWKKEPIDSKVLNNTTSSGVDLLEKFLIHDPKKRITLKEC